MAEAIALLGVVAAGVQCAQVGVQLLMLGASLRSRLKDAPDKVKRWLGQIEQLVALAELIKQTNADLSPRLLPPPSLLSVRSAATWVEAALLDCTSQAQALQDVLKDMLQEADDGKGQKIWKTILTVKRETRITSALHEIERQKSLLNIWLGQNNLRQLDNLHHTFQDFRDGVEKIDRHMVHVEQTCLDEFQNLSTAFHSSSRATASGLECLRNLSTSNVESLGQQMQQYHGDFQSESSVMQSQLRILTQEMRAMKHEFRRSAKFRARVSSTPSLLQEALQEHTKSQSLCLDTSNNSRSREIKRCYSTVTQTCSCRATSWLGLLNFGVNVQVALTHRNVHVKDCPAHKNMKSRFAAIRCYVQSTILENLVKLSFEAIHGAGGFSMGMLLRTYRTVQKHPLDSFFKDLYHKGRHKHRSRSIHPLYDDKTQDRLVKLTERELWRAFNSGIASPNDVDRNGRTLLHLQIEYSRMIRGREYRLCAQIIKLLISMGFKTDSLDARFCTTLQLLLKYNSLERLAGDQDSINGDILEWTGIGSGQILDGALMVECMRRWPESKEDWGYPYICDILLRKSKVDLELFISRGMKPVEETSRSLTPLHLAASANWPEAVALLLAGGADKYAQDSKLCLPIDFALHIECLETVELLLDGDCTPNFIRPRRHEIGTIPLSMVSTILSGKESIQNTLIHTLIRLRHSLGALRPYHALALLSILKESSVAVADRLFSGGFRDIELRDEHGRTPLMTACWCAGFPFARFLLEKGANALTPQGDSALTAGYFLAGSTSDSSFKAADLELCAKLLQTAFDVADTVESYCLCSPAGFTPVTALSRSHNSDRRHKFGAFMSCLQWSTCAVEQQARAFALGEVFDRLEMTHTCVNICQPNQQILEDDRLEIEGDEEEFNKQLEDLMEEYDLGRAEFSGGPLEFLDFFFEMQELNLPSQNYSMWKGPHSYNIDDKDLLGPGVQYQSSRVSFTGNEIFYGHREEVNEENMLALLFDEGHSWV